MASEGSWVSRKSSPTAEGTLNMLNWSAPSFCQPSLNLPRAPAETCGSDFGKGWQSSQAATGVKMRRDVLQRLRCCLDGDAGEQLNAIMQLWPPEPEAEMENDLLQNSL